MATPPMLRVRNRLADGFKDDAAELATKVVNGVLTVVDWARAFGSLIADGVTSAFMLGKGTNALDFRGHGIVTGLIQAQYSYAGPFAQAIDDAITAGTPMSEDAIAARSGLYAGGSVIHPFEVGKTDGIDLPYFPADGLTPCMGNCRCSWELVDDGTVITATWNAQDDFKVCDGCIERADAAPFTFASAA